MKIEATGNDDSSPFNRLPDEIVFEILNKLIDLKTLCICYAVCKRFCSIVVQVDTISVDFSPINDAGVPSIDSVAAYYKSVSFRSTTRSMKKFRGLKFLSINLPFPIQQHDIRYKWKVHLGHHRPDSFLFLSPNSIKTNANNSNGNGNGNEDDGEEGLELMGRKLEIASHCLWDATLRLSYISFVFPVTFPLLEKVSMTDWAKTGAVSLNVAKIVEMRNWLLSDSETIDQKYKHVTDRLQRISCCYIPSLELPASKYVMKGVTLFLMERDDLPNGHNSFLDFVEHLDNFEENEEEVAYNEALMEILKKHKGRIETL